MTELEEHEAFMAEVAALRRLRTVAAMVLGFHDQPVEDGRDDDAFEILREVLTDLDDAVVR